MSNGRDLAEQLAEAIALLPKDVYFKQRRATNSPPAEESFPVPEHVKPSAYAVINGELAIRDGDQMRLVAGLPAQTEKRIKGLIRVRDAVRRCLRSQMEATDEAEITSAREQLNQIYDHCIARLGFISERANAIAFRADPDLPLLLSLEHYDEETGRATKAAIFRERTIQRQRPIKEVHTPKDALPVALGDCGCVDVEYLSRLLHRSPEEFLPDLKGVIYLNPQTSRWETDDEYLSGNVRAKLTAAEAAALVDEKFRANVEALHVG